MTEGVCPRVCLRRVTYPPRPWSCSFSPASNLCHFVTRMSQAAAGRGANTVEDRLRATSNAQISKERRLPDGCCRCLCTALLKGRRGRVSRVPASRGSRFLVRPGACGGPGYPLPRGSGLSEGTPKEMRAHRKIPSQKLELSAVEPACFVLPWDQQILPCLGRVAVSLNRAENT